MRLLENSLKVLETDCSSGKAAIRSEIPARGFATSILERLGAIVKKELDRENLDEVICDWNAAGDVCIVWMHASDSQSCFID